MNRLENTVCREICAKNMIREGDGVIVGISGGADSVALLLILSALHSRLGCTLTAVHVEHGVRGEESLADEQFAAQLCEELKIECIREHVDMLQTAKERKLSEEEAGRMLRYEAFERIRRQKGARWIAVAHHANDQAETVLMNLSRGSALKGLGGIRQVNGSIIRPLLGITRKEIEDYLHEKGQAWRTDRTNLETEYTRNRIRMNILPLLESQVNAKAVQHICETAKHMQDADRYIQRQVLAYCEQCLQKLTDDGQQMVRINLCEYKTADPFLQPYILREAIAVLTDGHSLKDIGEVHVRILEDLAEKDCGAHADLPAGISAWRERTELILQRSVRQMKHRDEDHTEPEDEDTTGKHAENRGKSTDRAGEVIMIDRDGDYEMNGCCFSVAFGTNVQGTPPENQYTKWIAYDTMKGAICIRTRKAGDYLVVNDRGGRKKLKDYMIDQKIPRHERDTLPLLAQGSHILWTVGWRISEEAKINENTAQFMMISCRRKAYET